MRMRVAAFGLFVLLGCACCRAGQTIRFHVFNNYFSLNPQGELIVSDATIDVGDTVEWVWDQGYHSVEPVGGSIVDFDSGDQLPPFTFDYTFTEPGFVRFFCDLHAQDNGDGTVTGTMQGTLTIVPEPAIFLLPLVALAVTRRRRPSAGAISGN
jgi:hypothetical protein